MAHVFIKDPNDTESLVLDIPFEAGERSMQDFSGFTVAYKRFLEAKERNDEYLKATDTPHEQSVMDMQQAMIDCCAAMVTGDLRSLSDFSLPQDTYQWFETCRATGFVLTPENMKKDGISLERIFLHLVTIMELYAPDETISPFNYNFEWKGNRYYVLWRDAKRWATHTGFTVGEKVEVFGYKAAYQKRIEKQGDHLGKLLFPLLTQELAILAKRKGEELPLNTHIRAQFIKDRSELFKDLPLNICLDIRFFLQTFLLRYIKMQTALHSLKTPIRG